MDPHKHHRSIVPLESVFWNDDDEQNEDNDRNVSGILSSSSSDGPSKLQPRRGYRPPRHHPKTIVVELIATEDNMGKFFVRDNNREDDHDAGGENGNQDHGAHPHASSSNDRESEHSWNQESSLSIPPPPPIQSSKQTNDIYMVFLQSFSGTLTIHVGQSSSMHHGQHDPDDANEPPFSLSAVVETTAKSSFTGNVSRRFHYDVHDQRPDIIPDCDSNNSLAVEPIQRYHAPTLPEQLVPLLHEQKSSRQQHSLETREGEEHKMMQPHHQNQPSQPSENQPQPAVRKRFQDAVQVLNKMMLPVLSAHNARPIPESIQKQRSILRRQGIAVGGIPSSVILERDHNPTNTNRLTGDPDKSSLSSMAQSLFSTLGPSPTVSPLHALCSESSPQTFQKDWEAVLSNHSDAVFILDGRQRTPLHVLVENDDLLRDKSGRSTLLHVILVLIKAHPQAIIMKDSSGRIPFVSLLEEWFQWVYEMADIETQQQRTQLHPSRVLEQITSRFNEQVDTVMSGGILSGVMRRNGDTAALSLSDLAIDLYPSVEIWEEVDFCLQIMSMIVQEFQGKQLGILLDHSTRTASLKSHHTEDMKFLAGWIEQIAGALPFLIKTILLIETDGGSVRNRLLQMPIVRRLVLCPTTVGPWLITMLQRKGIPAKRAVDYLVIVSDAKPKDYFGDFHVLLKADVDDFEAVRQQIFKNLESCNGMIPSLVVLERKDTERAASSAAGCYIMNRSLERPFVVGLLLIDFILHLTLMLSVREDIGLASDYKTLADIPTSVALFICSHYIIRKIVESMAIFQLSAAVFRAYMINLWTIVDFATIALTLTAVSHNNRNPGHLRTGFNSLVIGLLWLKVLGFLKVANRHMATFIMAVMQILRDLKYFSIVLIVVIGMMGDMMSVAVSTKDGGEICDDENGGELDSVVADFCSPRRIDSYLRVYSLLLGDFELDSYRETDGLTALFVMFTVAGVIILLNVLIAVIDDSYERAKIAGNKLFGSGRVLFVAQNEALESFLRPGAKLSEIASPNSQKSWFVRLSNFFRWTVLISLISTALSAAMFLFTRGVASSRGDDGILFALLVFLMAIILSSALWILTMFVFEGIMKRLAPPPILQAFEWCKAVSNRIAGVAVTIIFDTKANMGDQILTTTQKEDDEGDWEGRLNYLERIIEKSLAKNKEEILKDMIAMEKRLGTRNYDGRNEYR